MSDLNFSTPNHGDLIGMGTFRPKPVEVYFEGPGPRLLQGIAGTQFRPGLGALSTHKGCHQETISTYFETQVCVTKQIYAKLANAHDKAKQCKELRKKIS